MADKYLNLTAVQTLKTWAKGLFSTQDDLDALDKKVDDIIAEGGEPNVIESIKKNGTAIAPDANKAVDIPIPTTAKSGSGEDEKVAITDGQNTHDVPTVAAMQTYVSEHGGVIQKMKLAGTELPIDSSDKSVNIPAATSSVNGAMSSSDKSKLDGIEAGAKANVQSDWNQTTTTADDFIKNKPTLPEDLADLTNTGTDPFAKMSDVESAVVGAYKPKGTIAFADLPALTAANLNNIYNISDAFVSTADFTEGAGHSHTAGTDVAIINVGTDQNPVYKYNVMVGPTDLSAFWTSEAGEENSLIAATVDEINAILNA